MNYMLRMLFKRYVHVFKTVVAHLRLAPVLRRFGLYLLSPRSVHNNNHHPIAGFFSLGFVRQVAWVVITSSLSFLLVAASFVFVSAFSVMVGVPIIHLLVRIIRNGFVGSIEVYVKENGLKVEQIMQLVSEYHVTPEQPASISPMLVLVVLIVSAGLIWATVFGKEFLAYTRLPPGELLDGHDEIIHKYMREMGIRRSDAVTEANFVDLVKDTLDIANTTFTRMPMDTYIGCIIWKLLCEKDYLFNMFSMQQQDVDLFEFASRRFVGVTYLEIVEFTIRLNGFSFKDLGFMAGLNTVISRTIQTLKGMVDLSNIKSLTNADFGSVLQVIKTCVTDPYLIIKTITVSAAATAYGISTAVFCTKYGIPGGVEVITPLLHYDVVNLTQTILSFASEGLNSAFYGVVSTENNSAAVLSERYIEAAKYLDLPYEEIVEKLIEKANKKNSDAN